MRTFLFCCGLLITNLAAGDEQIDLASFSAYIAETRAKAVTEGISEVTLDLAFKGIEPDGRVIGFDRNQPEFVQTTEHYLGQRVSDARVAEAKTRYRENRTAIDDIAGLYGIDGHYLVAFWGLESSFGRHQGKYDVVRSLATLGHDRRRSAFFTRELLNALRILDEGHVAKSDFVGGWAGAMGQNQFMPSTFRRFAVDQDGDGRKDIWGSHPDVWGSIANYLAKHGWRQGAGWGGMAELPASLDYESLGVVEKTSGCRAKRHHTKQRSLEAWHRLGVHTTAQEGSYSLLRPEDDNRTGYLIGGNFNVILSYNCANKYALSVGLLADRIMEGGSR